MSEDWKWLGEIEERIAPRMPANDWWAEKYYSDARVLISVVKDMRAALKDIGTGGCPELYREVEKGYLMNKAREALARCKEGKME